jgi:subtilisin family serine protease
MAVPGRCVVVAAGNAGQEAPSFAGDTSYVSGRIHTSGKLAARGLDRVLDWIVAGNGVVDASENEFELWYSAQDRFAVSLRPPGGDWIGPIEPQEYVENQQLRQGSFISIYNELYHPANGANYIGIYLSPDLDSTPIVGIPAGDWAVRLHAREVRNGEFHAWVERDDPRPVGIPVPPNVFALPSFFAEATNVDDTSVSSLACATSVVAVGNLDVERERINVTSSQGPTRDGRFKPDVAAPGTGIVAARGFVPEDPWVAMTGTSMAAPYITGVVALMLGAEPRLTAAQIEGIFHRTSLPLPGGDFKWVNDAGFGRVDAGSAVLEAGQAAKRTDRTKA